MMNDSPVPILRVERYWECPSCLAQHVTKLAVAHTPMHNCPKLGIVAPYVQVVSNEGIVKGSVRHVVVEREDYVGTEHGLRFDANNRPAMALHTERADGSHDTMVFPGSAAVSAQSIN